MATNTKKALLGSILAGGIALAAAVWANAGTATSILDLADSSAGQRGSTWGPVTPTEVGLHEVDSTVALTSGANFVDLGGLHNAFVFNLNPLHSVAVASAHGTMGFIIDTAFPCSNALFGSFLDGISCTGCGPGSSAANPGPLLFKVTHTSGITFSNFVANSSAYLYFADAIFAYTRNAAAESFARAVRDIEILVVLLGALGLLSSVGYVAQSRKKLLSLNRPRHPSAPIGHHSTQFVTLSKTWGRFWRESSNGR